jgi:hypothetical protein
VAAADRGDEAHRLASALVIGAGRSLLVPDAVACEADGLIRHRAGHDAARAFLKALTDGIPRRVALTETLFTRAVELDARYADLGLGLSDTSVMALAEAEHAGILTFDFEHFRAAPRPDGRPWDLVIDESRYLREIQR